MSATLIAVVLALFLGHAVVPLTRWRRYGWFVRWLALMQQWIGSAAASPFALLLTLGLPLLLVAWLQSALDDRFFGVPGLVFAVVVLLYCWGPRDLDVDVEAVAEAPDEMARQRAIGQLAGDDRPVGSDDAPGLVAAVFAGAKRRWFGILLWFMLLGPFGALLYRLAERGTRTDAAEYLPGAHAAAYRHLLAILNWPVAHLMALAMALVGSFDTVYEAWRQWHVQRRGQPFDFSTGFLDGVALASVQQSSRHEAQQHALDVEAGLEPPSDAPQALSWMNTAMALVWRILLTWLVLLALFVLAGYV